MAPRLSSVFVQPSCETAAAGAVLWRWRRAHRETVFLEPGWYLCNADARAAPLMRIAAVQACLDELLASGKWVGRSALNASHDRGVLHHHEPHFEATSSSPSCALSQRAHLPGRWVLVVGDSKARFVYSALLSLLNGTAPPLGWPTHRVDSGLCMSHVLPGNTLGLPGAFGYYHPGCALRWKGPCFDDGRGQAHVVCTLDYTTARATRLSYTWHSTGSERNLRAAESRLREMVRRAGRPRTVARLLLSRELPP